MEKGLNMSLLLDFYGDMLTDKQREAMELHYNEDLSLAEIADITGLTRPGVRDRLVKSKDILEELEDKLGLIARFENIKQEISDISQQLEALKNGGNCDIDGILNKLSDLQEVI